MIKRCTNSRCRKNFSTLYFTGQCPHCGKSYPGIPTDPKCCVIDNRLVPNRLQKRLLKALKNMLAAKIGEGPQFGGSKIEATMWVARKTGLSLRESEIVVESVMVFSIEEKRPAEKQTESKKNRRTLKKESENER